MLSSALLPLLIAVLPGLDRSPDEILSEIRAKGNKAPLALFEELGVQKTPAALDAILRGLDVVKNPRRVCKALQSLEHFRGVEGAEDRAVAFLVEAAQRQGEGIALHATWRLGSLWPASQPALAELALENERADCRAAALVHLVEHGMPLRSAQLDQMARSKHPAVRFEGTLARFERLVGVDKRAKALKKLLQSRNPIQRLVGVELLVSEPHPERMDRLRDALDDKYPPICRKALSTLERTRSKEAVEVLIDRLSSASQGERFRASSALTRLTGKPLGTAAGPWKRWWKDEGSQWHAPEEPFADTGPAAAPGGTRSFYGLPIHAERLVFAIDSSDSMGKPAAKGGDSRMSVAKLQLIQAIEGLPESNEFGLVHFGSSAWSWKKELVPAKGKNKRAAQGFVQYMEFSRGTEIYGALREAFLDPRADTILLLTDGDPQMSLMGNRAVIQRLVTQWNRTRNTTIDCLSIGTDRKWLRELATSTGGRYEELD